MACQAVLDILDSAWNRSMFDNNKLSFGLFSADDFGNSNPISTGVSLFLYSVRPNAAQRNRRTLSAIPSDGKNGRRIQRTPLSLDLHFLLTFWAKKASLQHDILGWAMRTLADNAILTSEILNQVGGDESFSPDETLEIILNDVSDETLLKIWDGLPQDYHLSVPYIARVLRIESLFSETEETPVRIRELQFGDYEE